MPIGAATAVAGGSAFLGAGSSIIAGKKVSKAQKNAADSAARSAERADETNRYIFDTTRNDYAPQRQIGYGAANKLADMYGVSRFTDRYADGDRGLQTAQPYGVAAQYANIPGIGNIQIPNYNTGRQPQQGRALTEGYGGFEESPGYAFRRDEALKSLERGASARGQRYSNQQADGSTGNPGTAKALMRYADNLASAEYNQFADRLAQMAGLGTTANEGSALAGRAYGSATNQNANLSANAAIRAGDARASGYANTNNAITDAIQGIGTAYGKQIGERQGPIDWGGGGAPRLGTPGTWA